MQVKVRYGMRSLNSKQSIRGAVVTTRSSSRSWTKTLYLLMISSVKPRKTLIIRTLIFELNDLIYEIELNDCGRIYIKDLLAFGVENGKSEMWPQKYSVVGANLKYNGEIKVGVTFTLEGH